MSYKNNVYNYSPNYAHESGPACNKMYHLNILSTKEHKI